VNFGTRALDPDPAKGRELIGKIKIYPLGQSANPAPVRLIAVDGKAWSQVQPRGLDYWKRLHKILQVEPVEERDRMMMAMLAPLGIEKGKPFAPDERQQKLLIKGAETGELMAMNFSFNKRFEGARYRPDAHWDYVLTFDPSQEEKNFTQLDRRSAWFYEAVTSSKGMPCAWLGSARRISVRITTLLATGWTARRITNSTFHRIRLPINSGRSPFMIPAPAVSSTTGKASPTNPHACPTS
jgi:hypothetical protein